jgi:hypothetical protein
VRGIRVIELKPFDRLANFAAHLNCPVSAVFDSARYRRLQSGIRRRIEMRTRSDAKVAA